MPDKKSDDNLVKQLKGAGLRLTPQRLAIYRVLVESKEHPTAQHLHETLQDTLPSLSPATVYNTLQTLVEHGLVHELGDAGDGAIHYDADLAPHLNLICTRCHRIDDFHADGIKMTSQQVADESGYAVMGARLVYYGLCPACQAELAAEEKS